MHILGFQEFLNRAEKDQLERMKDRNLFSRFFPYALALDVADNWAKAFEGIYQEKPDWYVSPGAMGTFTRSASTSHLIQQYPICRQPSIPPPAGAVQAAAAALAAVLQGAASAVAAAGAGEKILSKGE